MFDSPSIYWLLQGPIALLLLGAVAVGPESVVAQEKIAFVDTEYVLNKMPEYATVQDKLSKLEQKWRSEIEEKRKEVETLERKFEARELLYTEQERSRKQQAIESARKEVEQLRQRYFGPDGKLYSRQKKLMRPIQKRILEATEAVATDAGYDYVVDRKGEALFLYATEDHNVSDLVLRELGINVEQESGASDQVNPDPGQESEPLDQGRETPDQPSENPEPGRENLGQDDGEQ